MSKKTKTTIIKPNSNVERVKKAILDVAKSLSIKPSEVTKKDLMNSDADISDWALKMVGGLNIVKNAYFPMEEKELSTILEAKNEKKYINKLESIVGARELIEKQIISAIENKLEPLLAPKSKVHKFKKSKANSNEIVAMLNDTHYGLIVDSEEVDGLNSYSWKEACRRTAAFVKEVNEYKIHRRDIKNSKLHLVLNGDLLAGTIHGLASKTLDLWIHQINGGTHILVNAISALLSGFSEIEVHCMGGNHEELAHKREGGHRAAQEHYDNYSNAMFYALSIAFRNYKNVKFNIPKTPYLFIDLPMGRAMAVHGHNIFSKQLGNPGTSINVKALTNAIRDFNSGEKLKGRDPVKLVLCGHTHAYAHFVTNDGVEVYNAPSMSGLDGFAHQLNINTSFTGQVVFETTSDFILGDSRLIRFGSADTNAELDKIIPVYKKELSWVNNK